MQIEMQDREECTKPREMHKTARKVQNRELCEDVLVFPSLSRPTRRDQILLPLNSYEHHETFIGFVAAYQAAAL
jgi:hypothetical protein